MENLVDPGVSFDIATEFTCRVKGNLQEMQETRLTALSGPK